MLTELKRLKWVLTTTQYFVMNTSPSYTVNKALTIQILEKVLHSSQIHVDTSYFGHRVIVDFCKNCCLEMHITSPKAHNSYIIKLMTHKAKLEVRNLCE